MSQRSRLPSLSTAGNAAWRAGRYAEAVAEYARLLMQAPELAETLAIAESLALARRRDRRERAALGAAARVAMGDEELAPLYALLVGIAAAEMSGVQSEADGRLIEQALAWILEHPYERVRLSRAGLPDSLIGLLYALLWESVVCVEGDDAEPLSLARLFQLSPELHRFRAWPALGALLCALSVVHPDSRGGVSIIILTLNGAALLDRLLGSFVATNTLHPVELIIVDHGALDDPGDETAAVIERYRAVCELWHLRRGANHSFSASCNFGAEWARYPNLLFLNNDIVYCADALPAALAKLAEPEIGCVGVRLDDDPESLAPGQEAGIQHLGIEFVWSEARGYHQPRQIRQASLGRYLESGAGSGGGRQPAVTGAFLLCRRRDFRRLGGFSTEYDYGLEDIDFCLRLTRDLGKQAWCLTELGLRHAESSTRRRDRALTKARIERNHRRFKALWAGQTRALGAARVGRVAVVVHVYYPELWSEVAERLKGIDWPFDLYVTTTPEVAPRVASVVHAAFPVARIEVYPNLGMDVLPFLRLAPALIRAEYLAVCKLHTKRGEGEPGATWRRAMLEPLIGDGQGFAAVVEAFARSPRLQLVGPGALYQSARGLMLGNGPLVSALYAQLSGRALAEADWGFFVGTMFWIRPGALRALLDLMVPGALLDPGRFETEYQLDGQRVHAIERVFGLLPGLEGGEVGLIHAAVDGGWCLQLPPPAPRVGGARIGTLMPQFQRLRDDMRTLKECPGFDAEPYLREWPELAGSQVDLRAHHLLIGRFLASATADQQIDCQSLARLC